jgi:phosphopantothenoylcysteine decarboxylase/phosphopantothenate--cysteine ligase
MEPMLKKNILLGVTGGIAAYKSAELIRLLIKAGAEVRVVMTAGAAEFGSRFGDGSHRARTLG